jgi:DNA-binding NtrC family response regulator/tetratricopeptide (TPR) repeat protein
VPTPFETASSLAAEGRFNEAFLLLDKNRPASGSTASWTVLRGELLERLGRFTQSKALLDTFLKSGRATFGELSSCEFTVGKIKWDEGETAPALVHLQRAVALAIKAGDLRQKCWANLWLLTLVADRSGPDAAVAILRDLRRDATKLGDARITSALHAFAAQVDAKRGLFRSALIHVKQSRELLAAAPNLWLEALLEYTMSNIFVLRSEHRTALKHGRRAVEFAEGSGAAVCLRTCLASLGVVFYSLGQFAEAAKCLSQGIEILPTTGDSRWGMIDTLARIRLSQGETQQCAELLDEIQENTRNSDDRLLYGHRYSSLTRSQMLGLRGDYSGAFAEIDHTLDLAAASQDKLLTRAGLLTKAQLLEQTAQVPEALKLLDSFPVRLTGESPDTYAQYEAILACSLVSTGNIGFASAHRDRAEQIYRGLAHAPGLIELSRCWDRAYSEFSDKSTSADDLVTPPKVATPASTTQSIAALMMLAERPELLARGIVDLLDTTVTVHQAIAAIERGDGKYEVLAAVGKGEHGPGSVAALPRRIAVGHIDEQSVDVWVNPRTDVESVATLNAVTLLLSAIHEIERGRAEREERLTLWPIEDVPIQNVGQAIVQGRMREVMELARRVATTNAGVLIIGESGTGKEILARAIHTYSERADKPLVPFNCAALPREMLESQLFGHRRGAFTGADRDNPGVIRTARGGTLFLDEVGELSLDLQPKLLRFLESGEICPLGETTPFIVDVRVIAATNANLEHAVKNGRFREDLFYRLNVVPLQIPPLRERRDEIPALVHHFVMRAAAEYRKGQVRIAENTLEQLLLFEWPGNVRQLQNELRRMVALAEPGAVLTPRALSAEIASVRAEVPVRHGGSPTASFPDKLSPTLARIEREMIQAALREHRGKMEATAKALGISRKGLYLKRQRLGL